MLVGVIVWFHRCQQKLIFLLKDLRPAKAQLFEGRYKMWILSVVKAKWQLFTLDTMTLQLTEDQVRVSCHLI